MLFKIDLPTLLCDWLMRIKAKATMETLQNIPCILQITTNKNQTKVMNKAQLTLISFNKLSLKTKS